MATLLAALSITNARAAEIAISAAASLSNAFRELGSAFEAAHPDTELLLNFAPSDALVQQLGAGATVDVLATADQQGMDRAVARGLVLPATRRDFTANRLVVIVPKDAQSVPHAIADLASAAIARIALANPTGVPAGRYARRALSDAGLWPLPTGKAIYAQSVRQALDYAARGDVDAALVYATDAAMHGDKVKLAFEVPLHTPIIYPLAQCSAGANGAGAAQFIAFVASTDGQAILARFGFEAP